MIVFLLYDDGGARTGDSGVVCSALARNVESKWAGCALRQGLSYPLCNVVYAPHEHDMPHALSMFLCISRTATLLRDNIRIKGVLWERVTNFGESQAFEYVAVFKQMHFSARGERVLFSLFIETPTLSPLEARPPCL